MSKAKTIIVATLAVIGLLISGGSLAADDQESVQVVTTFSILKDIVGQVGGDLVEIHSMVPMGTDPHEYQPLPQDIVAATRADVLFWNGLDMETGDGWFRGLVEVAGKSFEGDQVIEMAAGVEPLYLTDGAETEVNPHAFLSPRAGIIYTENALGGLQAADPANADVYAANAAAYIAELETWDASYADGLGSIPEEARILVTSERAFQYLAADYGITEGYLWEIDTDEQGTPQQIASLIAFVREAKPAGLLVETNVDARPMETVSRETGVPIVGEIYSDELGPEGSPGETYVSYLDYNLQMLMKAMRPD